MKHRLSIVAVALTLFWVGCDSADVSTSQPATTAKDGGWELTSTDECQKTSGKSEAICLARFDRDPDRYCTTYPTDCEAAPPPTGEGFVPITEMHPDSTYFGYPGFAYDGSNQMPLDQRQRMRDAGRDLARQDTVVLMAIGMSNNTQVWCHQKSPDQIGTTDCHPWTFTGQALALPNINPNLIIVNCAQGGKAWQRWDGPDEDQYQRCSNEVLPMYGLTPADVDIVWTMPMLKNPIGRERYSLPHPEADVFELEEVGGNVLRSLQTNYPNIQQYWFSSRASSIYATNPDGNGREPFSYEACFGGKWIIQSQIDQFNGAAPHPRSGDLTLVAPIGWATHLYSNAEIPNMDGYYWTPHNGPLPPTQVDDGIHPNQLGEEMVGEGLVEFFSTNPATRRWFLE